MGDVGPFLSLIPVVRQPTIAVLSWRQPQRASSPFTVGHLRRFPLATNDKESMSGLVGSKTDKRKQSLYFPESMLQEIKEEAARLDRSLSWVVQRAWKISRMEIKKLPSVNDVEGAEDEEGG